MRLFLKIGYLIKYIFTLCDLNGYIRKKKNAYIIIVYKLNPIFLGKYKFMSLFLYGIKLLYTCFVNLCVFKILIDVKIHNFSFSNIKQVLLLS